ncbi:MAG: O-antigen ligase family protein [Pseudomonadota bacterium]
MFALRDRAAFFDLQAKRMVVLAFAAAVLSTALLSVAAALVILFWLLSGRFAETWQRVKTEPAVWMTLGLLGLCLVGLLYTPALPKEALDGAGKYAKLLLLPLALFLLDDERWIWRALYAFLLALTLAVFASYLEGYGLTPDWTATGDRTAFAGHITLSLFEAIGAFAVFTLARFQAQRRWLWIALGLFFLSHLFILNTGRTGQVLALAMLMVLMFQALRWKGVLVGMLAATLLVAAAWLGSEHFQQRVQEGVHDLQKYSRGDANNSLGARLDFLDKSLQIIQDRPLSGYGTGSLKKVYPSYASTQDVLTDNTHNEFLMVSVQWGLPALFLLLGLYFFLARATPMLQPEAAAMMWGLLVAYAVGGLFNSLLLDHREGMMFALLAGLLLAWRKPQDAARP